MNTSLGYRHYQRQERREALKERIGNALLWIGIGAVLGWFLAGSVAHAAVPKSYELVIGIFDSSQSHDQNGRTYRDVIRVPGFASQMACLLAGEGAVELFVAQRNTRKLSQDLIEYTCMPVLS